MSPGGVNVVGATIRKQQAMLNIIVFPETRKSKGDGQPNSADLGPADTPLIYPLSAQTVANPVFRWKVQRLGGGGERPYAELLAELGARYGLTAEIDRLLDRYNAIYDEAFNLTNAGDFWPTPLYLVHGATG